MRAFQSLFLTTAAFVAFCLVALNVASAVHLGDDAQWTRHGYVVKLLGRAVHGTVKSSSSVLTAGECALDERSQPIAEFRVLHAVRNTTTHRVLAAIVEQNAAWTALKLIEPLNVEKTRASSSFFSTSCSRRRFAALPARSARVKCYAHQRAADTPR